MLQLVGYYSSQFASQPQYAHLLPFFFLFSSQIPLAKKLRDCKVFGVSSDEVLNYATLNRNEWEARGKDIVAGLVRDLKKLEEAPGAGDILEEDEEAEAPLEQQEVIEIYTKEVLV